MVGEKYLDDLTVTLEGFEFDLQELEDLEEWFSLERPLTQYLTPREMAAYANWKYKK